MVAAASWKAPFTLLLALTIAAAGCTNQDAEVDDLAPLDEPMDEEGRESDEGDSEGEEAPDGMEDGGDEAEPGHPRVMALRDAIHEALSTEQPVNVTARPVGQAPTGTGSTLGDAIELRVIFQESQILTDGTWTEVDGERVPMPPMEAYEGHVEGEPDWPVRLTLTQTWARGYILTLDETGPPQPLLVRINLDGNLPISEIPDTDTEGQAPLLPQVGDGPEASCFPSPTPVTPVTERPTSLDPVTVRIVLDGDQPYRDALGDDAFPLMVAMLQPVDAIYQTETGLRFEIVGLHLHTDSNVTVQSGYPQYGGDPPAFDAIRAHWNDRADIPRDLVHMFTGRDAGGEASCIGGAGMPEHAYTYTPVGYEQASTEHPMGGYPVGPTYHTNVLAHEIGHLFNADHTYGNHAESQGEMATLMIQGYTPGDRPAFSTLSKAMIRGWADAHLTAEQPRHAWTP